MCPAFVCGSHGPLAFRAVQVPVQLHALQSARVVRVVLLRRFQPACCISSFMPLPTLLAPQGACLQAACISR